jgi:hypothetical protein
MLLRDALVRYDRKFIWKINIAEMVVGSTIFDFHGNCFFSPHVGRRSCAGACACACAVCLVARGALSAAC